MEAAPVNNILHSIFSKVQLLINGEKVTGNYEQYPYKAYITDLIATEHHDKVTLMEGCLKWIPDTSGQMDARTATNAGWFKRRADSVGDDHKCVIGRPHLDSANSYHPTANCLSSWSTNLFSVSQAQVHNKVCWTLEWAHLTTPSPGVRSSSTPWPKELRTIPSPSQTPPRSPPA